MRTRETRANATRQRDAEGGSQSRRGQQGNLRFNAVAGQEEKHMQRNLRTTVVTHMSNVGCRARQGRAKTWGGGHCGVEL